MNAKEMFEESGYKRSEKNGGINYFQRFGNGYFRITFDLSKEEVAIFTNMGYVIESDLLQAIIQQAKELGWLEEEKKTELNIEHYYDKLTTYGMDGLAVTNGKVTQCSKIRCRECDFSRDCGNKRFIWLASPYKKPRCRLSRFEFDLLDIYKKCGMQKCITNYSTLLELNEKGYFKEVDLEAPIGEILENCEIKGE